MLGYRELTCALLLFGSHLAGCDAEPRRSPPAAWTPASDSADLYPIEIARPAGTGRLPTALVEVSGSPARIGCPTCHGEGSGPPLAQDKGPTEVHADLELNHADLKCTSCHDEADPSRLRDVDGARFDIVRSMRLCSQCHGPIRRAFDHGAHGGMRGYWDRQRGPKIRNDCITCHDPHAPTYPKVSPAPPPRDRFTREPHASGSEIERRFSGGSHE